MSNESRSAQELQELRRELAALRQRIDLLEQPRSERGSVGRPVSRAGLLRTAGAVAAGVAASTLVGPTGAALASNGSNVIAGQDNTATSVTSLTSQVLGDAALRASNYYSGPYDDYSDGFQGYTYGAGLAAVYGRNDAAGGSGVMGYSANGVGGTFGGGGANLRLQPAASAGPPTSNNHQQGEVYVDANGAVWVCTVSGSPTTVGTFTQLGSPGVQEYVTAADSSDPSLNFSSGWTGYPFPAASVTHDFGGPHWSSSAPSTFNILHTGLYLMTGYALFYPTSNSTATRGIRLIDASSNVYTQSVVNPVNNASYWYAASCASIAYIAAGVQLLFQLYGDASPPESIFNVTFGLVKLV